MVNEHKNELGFVRKVTLDASLRQNEIFVAESDGKIVGFLHYHHRRDLQTTLYHVVVSLQQRRQGIGTLLLKSLIKESRSRNKRWIVLKCPVNSPANHFYHQIGFYHWRIEPGKRRALNVWKLVVTN